MIKSNLPNRLYKYRAFSNITLEMLVDDNIYFADPSTFNDPLDTKPEVQVDVSTDELAHILWELVEQRIRSEMTAAARTIKYRGPKTIDHIARHSRSQADQLISDIKYNATNPEIEVDDPELLLMRPYVRDELLRRYDKGVFSLAVRPDCPLMWSHYGDQHRGICLGYSAPKDVTDQIGSVHYGGSRLIKASLIASMLRKESTAQRELDSAVLFRKAHAWGYEKEWRLIGDRGQHASPLELKEVVFGMRCSSPVIYAVVKALEDRQRKVRFHEVSVLQGRFLLRKRALDVEELKIGYPRCHRAILDSFSDLT